jgi:hypothetical protein
LAASRGNAAGIQFRRLASCRWRWPPERRILNGSSPQTYRAQSTKFELVINAESARMLGLTSPPKLLACADDVIE